MSEFINFADEIDKNKTAEQLQPEVVTLETPTSSLDVRLQGAFITECQLTSPESGERVDLLYAEPDISKPKLAASHPMMPAGAYEGIGGQHGFPRWADYHSFAAQNSAADSKSIGVQAMRSDNGLSLSKRFDLTGSTLTTHTTIRSSEDAVEETSIGDHLYFSLKDEELSGLKLNGQSLDELLGEGSEDTLKSAQTLFWNFDEPAQITFPAGHTVKLSAEFQGETEYPLALWIWKRPDSPSICFEPVVGVEYLGDHDRAGVKIAPYTSAVLSTHIELI